MTWLYVPSACAPESVDLISDSTKEPDARAWEELARLADKDPRHLWPDVARILRECAAPLGFFENVGGHLSRGGREVIAELQAMGYRTAATLFTAEEVGAPHRRERLFILAAHPERVQLREQQGRGGRPGGQGAPKPGNDGANAMGNANSQGELQSRGSECHKRRRIGDPSWWSTEPDVGRVVDGAPARVDRLRALGNGVVPAQAAAAFVELWEALVQVQHG